MINFLYVWLDSVCENLNNLFVECGGYVNRLCIYIVNFFDSNNNYWLYVFCFIEEFNLFKKVIV